MEKVHLSPLTFGQFRLGRIYQLIKPVSESYGLHKYGLKVGDMIVVMETTYEYSRYEKEFRSHATKIVKLDCQYVPSFEVGLGKWMADYFMEVDMTCLPTEVHNNYVLAMKVTPEWMLMCV